MDIVPAAVRNILGSISYKLQEAEGKQQSMLEFTGAEIDQLVTVFDSDLPPFDAFTYLSALVKKSKVVAEVAKPKEEEKPAL
jgi:hypothetical protein